MSKAVKRVLSMLLCAVMLLVSIMFDGHKGFFEVKATDSRFQVGDTIEFGSYPQNRVRDNDLIDSLNSCDKLWISYQYFSGNGNGIPSDSYDGHNEGIGLGSMASDDFMWYADFYYAGTKYRAVTFEEYRPCGTDLERTSTRSYQDDNGYYVNTTYYFEYSPISWRILNEDGLLISALSIDSQAYNNTVYWHDINGNRNVDTSNEFFYDVSGSFYANDYSVSSIRTWLNNDFYHTAFNASEANSLAFGPTNDKVFALSNDEVHQYFYSNGDRITRGTDYAKCQGLYICDSTQSHWIIRTPWESRSDWCYVVDRLGFTANDGVCNTSRGVRPAIKLKTQFFESNYIQQHMNFISNGQYEIMTNNYSFYNYVWQYEKDGAWMRRFACLRTWDQLGDIAEMLTFKFDKLEFTKNYYSIFLADFIKEYLDTTGKDELELKYFKNYKKYFSGINDLFKDDEDWTADLQFLWSNFDLVYKDGDGILLSSNELSGNGSLASYKLFGDFYINHIKSFEEVFNGLSNAAQICGYIGDAVDIYNAYVNAYNAYIVAECFKEVSDELFNMLRLAAFDMAQNGDEVNAGRLLMAINEYERQISLDSCFIAAVDAMKSLSVKTVDMVARSVVQKVAYTAIADAMGVAVAEVAAPIAAYVLTYNILDCVCKMSKSRVPYYMMTYIAPFEHSFTRVSNIYANRFKDNPTYDNALKFDLAYRALQTTNAYLYQCCYNFSSVGTTAFDEREAEDVDLCASMKSLWENTDCHDSKSVSQSNKVANVFCPVDIYVFDSLHTLKLSVVNEEIAYTDGTISVCMFDGKKTLVYPSTMDYDVEIVSRESGEMDYRVSEWNGDTQLRNVSYYNLPLISEREYVGSVPALADCDIDLYNLSSNGQPISADYTSVNSCEDNLHVFDPWKTYLTSACGASRQERTCSICGFTQKQCTAAEHKDIETVGSVEPTCTENGWTGNVCCVTCGEILDNGHVIQSTGHYAVIDSAVEATETSTGRTMGMHCSVCNEVIIEQEIIPKLVKYNITFDPNGGTSVPSPQSGYVNRYMSIILSDTIPIRGSYTFYGWNTRADGSGTKYAPGANYTTEADVTLYAQWIANTPVVNPAASNNTVVDESTHFIFGLSTGSSQNCISVTDGTASFEYPTAKQVMGTGTKVNIYNNDNELVDSYTIVIFGDIDGDGRYDGMDAFIVSLITAGLLTENDLSAAARMAADCNHDGTIDDEDFRLLERAGLLLAEVDQSRTQEEPLETNSAYVEYLSLIDQSIEPEVIEDDANDAQIVEDPLSETVQTVDAPWYLKLLQFLAEYIGKILSIFFAH